MSLDRYIDTDIDTGNAYDFTYSNRPSNEQDRAIIRKNIHQWIPWHHGKMSDRLRTVGRLNQVFHQQDINSAANFDSVLQAGVHPQIADGMVSAILNAPHWTDAQQIPRWAVLRDYAQRFANHGYVDQANRLLNAPPTAEEPHEDDKEVQYLGGTGIKTRNGSTRKWRKLRQSILERDDFKCNYCGKKANHVDHIVPWKHGGKDTPSNLIAACRTCNLSKGSLKVKEFNDVSSDDET